MEDAKASRGSRGRSLGLIAVILCVWACGRVGYDPLAQAENVMDAGDTTIDSGIDPTPTVIATSGFPFELESNGSDLIWSDHDTGAVFRVKAGTVESIPLLAPRASAKVFGVALDETFVYVCDSETGEIRRVPLEGGQEELLVTSPCRDLVVVDPFLYWTNTDPAQPAIRRMDKAGGTVEDMSEARNATNLVAKGRDIYFTSYFDGEILRLGANDTTSSVLASVDANGPWGLEVAGDFVYVAEHHGGGGQVSRVPITGGALEPLAIDQAGAHKLAVDGDKVYWTSEFDGKVLEMVIGQAPVTISSGLDSPLGLEITDDAIYWTTRAGELWRAGR